MSSVSSSLDKDIFYGQVARKLDDMHMFNRVYPMELFQLFISTLKEPIIRLNGLNPLCIRILQRHNFLDKDMFMDKVTAFALDHYISYNESTRSIRFI